MGLAAAETRPEFAEVSAPVFLFGETVGAVGFKQARLGGRQVFEVSDHALADHDVLDAAEDIVHAPEGTQKPVRGYTENGPENLDAVAQLLELETQPVQVADTAIGHDGVIGPAPRQALMQHRRESMTHLMRHDRVTGVSSERITETMQPAHEITMGTGIEVVFQSGPPDTSAIGEPVDDRPQSLSLSG